MLEGLAGDTRVIVYLMAGIGVLGILAKIINQLTLYRLVRAAGNMPKSTHRLIKLVRAKYEHACMIHDSVENIDAFVESYSVSIRGDRLKYYPYGLRGYSRRLVRRLITFLSVLRRLFINILRQVLRKWYCFQLS